jgi:cbb3-type cytochrome oxidase subunit 3
MRGFIHATWPLVVAFIVVAVLVWALPAVYDRVNRERARNLEIRRPRGSKR